jgi:hypothetical protein
MPDFNAKADVYVVIMKDPQGRHAPQPPRKPIHSGTVAQCIAWTLANHDGYPATYSVEVPREAGFGRDVLSFQDIEDLACHPQFPR